MIDNEKVDAVQENIVEVVEVVSVEKHPNADRLEIVGVLGTQFVSAKGEFTVGSGAIYFPPDTVIDPSSVDETTASYLKKGNRVGAIRLRGCPSFGFGLKTKTSIGTNLTNAFGATHWQPPSYQGEGRLDTPGVFQYTHIQHYYKHTGCFRGKEVVITEKLHGQNLRVGVCKGEVFVGSHRRLRNEDSVFGAGLPLVSECLKDAANAGHNLTFYGELFGKGIQFMDYGVSRGVRMFDAMLNGVYMNWEDFNELCNQYSIPMVPVLYRGMFDNELIGKYTDGASFGEHTCEFKGREGIVIKPVVEARGARIGRLIAKSVSADYYEHN